MQSVEMFIDCVPQESCASPLKLHRSGRENPDRSGFPAHWVHRFTIRCEPGSGRTPSIRTRAVSRPQQPTVLAAPNVTSGLSLLETFSQVTWIEPKWLERCYFYWQLVVIALLSGQTMLVCLSTKGRWLACNCVSLADRYAAGVRHRSCKRRLFPCCVKKS